MPEIGVTGLIVILVVALLLFGPKRLPEIGRSLGQGMREFKDSIAGFGASESAPEPLEKGAEPPASGPLESGHRVCSECGAKARPEDRFCASCGASLERSPKALTG